MTRDREYSSSLPRRRNRHGRVTREAKRRRDARRNGRKLAAHFLDAKLTKEFDDTLTRANFQPLPRINVQPPPPTFATPSVLEPSTALVRSPSPPPQLPPLNLGQLDLRNFSKFFAPSAYTPPTPAPVCKGVPSWCPPIPSRTHNGVWAGELPKFWDLSRLPESSMPSNFESRKKSRFFPLTEPEQEHEQDTRQDIKQRFEQEPKHAPVEEVFHDAQPEDHGTSWALTPTAEEDHDWTLLADGAFLVEDEETEGAWAEDREDGWYELHPGR